MHPHIEENHCIYRVHRLNEYCVLWKGRSRETEQMWPRVKQSNGHSLCQGLGSLALPRETISSFIIYSVVMYFLQVGFTTVPSWSHLHARMSGRNPEWSEKWQYCLPLPGHRRPTWSAEEEWHSFHSWGHILFSVLPGKTNPLF